MKNINIINNVIKERLDNRFNPYFLAVAFGHVYIESSV